MKRTIKSKEKTAEYIHAAKQEKVAFTHEKLRSIVKNASPASDGFYLNSQRKTRTMISILGITLAGAVTSAVLWLQPQPLPQPQQSLLLASQNTSIPKTETTPQTTTQNTTPRVAAQPVGRETTVQHVAQNKEAEQVQKQEGTALNIDGITSVGLSFEEAVFLGITSAEDCGITLSQEGMTTTLLKDKTMNRFKTEEDGTSNNAGGGYIIQPNNPSQKTALFSPSLVTTEKGVIRLDAMNIARKTDVDASQTAPIPQGGSGKPVITVFKYPKDTSFTEERIKEAESDTSKVIVKVKRLTPEDVIAMEKESKERKQVINQQLRMNKFIAVRVESSCSGYSLMFWYEPSMEFIRQLPSRYQAVLLNEVYGNTGQGGSITLAPQTSTPEEPKPGCRYLDACRAAAGAIMESSVYPNPASGNVSLRFSLSQPRVCSFSLHYLNGIFAKQLGAQSKYNTGENTFNASLDGVEAGMYLLSMITEKNERIVQRVVIEK